MIYKNAQGCMAVHYSSKMYKEIVKEKHFKDLKKEVVSLGASHMFATYATDEMLVYFIVKKKGLI